MSRLWIPSPLFINLVNGVLNLLKFLRNRRKDLRRPLQLLTSVKAFGFGGFSKIQIASRQLESTNSLTFTPGWRKLSNSSSKCEWTYSTRVCSFLPLPGNVFCTEHWQHNTPLKITLENKKALPFVEVNLSMQSSRSRHQRRAFCRFSRQCLSQFTKYGRELWLRNCSNSNVRIGAYIASMLNHT